jgi:hypothetical protein
MASYKDYKSISAAKKAGSMYYTDKNGKKALAVTKEQLDSWKKKNKGKFKGSALTAWANAKGKNLTDTKPPATKPKAKPSTPGSKRPPKRPLGAPTLRERNPIKTETLLPGSDKTLEDALKQPRGRGDGAQETLIRQTHPKSPSRLKGQAVMKKITRSQWQNMSKSERRALGLPATRVAAVAGKLRDAKFKDGKSF